MPNGGNIGNQIQINRMNCRKFPLKLKITHWFIKYFFKNHNTVKSAKLPTTNGIGDLNEFDTHKVITTKLHQFRWW
jgi:hypothetical protein